MVEFPSKGGYFERRVEGHGCVSLPFLGEKGGNVYVARESVEPSILRLLGAQPNPEQPLSSSDEVIVAVREGDKLELKR